MRAKTVTVQTANVLTAAMSANRASVKLASVHSVDKIASAELIVNVHQPQNARTKVVNQKIALALIVNVQVMVANANKSFTICQWRPCMRNILQRMTKRSNYSSMYKFQSAIPKYPVPDLETTCAKYLQSVTPLLSPQEFIHTQSAVKEFLEGKGKVLQKRLLEKSSKVDSWLIDWWNKFAYQTYRESLVWNVNYYFQFKDESNPKFQTQTGRAASLIQAMMQFRERVISETLTPDMIRDQPLDMEMYKYLFNTCKIPIIPEDKTINFGYNNKHIVVVSRGNFYSVRVIDDNGQLISTSDIEIMLQKIQKKATKNTASIGTLTADHRDVWAEFRTNLVKNPQNEKNLETIQSAAFLVCLDETSPVTRRETGRSLWDGECANRFYDKSFQLIVFKNGKAGVNNEHSMMDGMVTNRFCEDVLEALSSNSCDHGINLPQSGLQEPEHLEFVLDEKAKSQICESEKKFVSLKPNYQLENTVFRGYGKNGIKSMKCSPDAFAQMAIQLAYFKMFGKPCATYESAQTRKYAFGRTETVRSCSVPSSAWVKSMNSGMTKEEQASLLRAAIQHHTLTMKQAVDANGVDRHLFGLKLCVQKGEPLPKLFTDVAYGRSFHFNLSTSQVANPHFEGYGWGAVVDDGFGIPYMIQDDALHFTVTSRQLNASQFIHFLEESLVEMKSLLSDSSSNMLKSKL